MAVAVLFPTYRNSRVFGLALESVLSQTYGDVDIFIHDNGLADGYTAIRDVALSANDKRVHYFANHQNIGAWPNYHQLFRRAATIDSSIILPADAGLRKDAIEVMLRVQAASRADWVRPQSMSLLRPKGVEARSAFSNLGVGDRNIVKVAKSWDVLKHFFSDENLDGELDRTSWVGALIRGRVWQQANIQTIPLRWHGAEQYITMRLLVSALFRYAFVDAPLKINLLGAPRYGTERPQNDYTRLESVQATDLILHEKHSVVEDIAIEAFAHQCRALLRFLTHYRGFRVLAVSMLGRASLQFIAAVARSKRSRLFRKQCR